MYVEVLTPKCLRNLFSITKHKPRGGIIKLSESKNKYLTVFFDKKHK